MAALANLAHFSPQILDFSHLHQRPELESLSPNYPLQISTFTFSTHISRFITQHLSIYHFHKHKLKFSKKNLVKCGLYIFLILIFITHVHRPHLKWLSPRYSQCCYFGKSTLVCFNIFQRLLKMDQS